MLSYYLCNLHEFQLQGDCTLCVYLSQTEVPAIQSLAVSSNINTDNVCAVCTRGLTSNLQPVRFIPFLFAFFTICQIQFVLALNRIIILWFTCLIVLIVKWKICFVTNYKPENEMLWYFLLFLFYKSVNSWSWVPNSQNNHKVFTHMIIYLPQTTPPQWIWVCLSHLLTFLSLNLLVY